MLHPQCKRLGGLICTARPTLEHCRVTTVNQDFGDADAAALVHCSSHWRVLEIEDETEAKNSALTDAGVIALAPLTALTDLVLYGCGQVTDVGVAALAPLTALATLSLSECCAVTDVGVAALAPLTALTSLDLTSCQVTDESVATLAPLTALATLSLGGCEKVTDD